MFVSKLYPKSVSETDVRLVVTDQAVVVDKLRVKTCW